MHEQYWGATVEKPTNMFWFIFWQSRAHAAAFAADPLHANFVDRRESLATNPVRDIRVAQLWVEAPFTDVGIYKMLDTHIEKGNEVALAVVHTIRSLKAPGFTGSSFGVVDEDPAVGVYITGWNSVEEHLSLGMGEGDENQKFRDESEEAMRYMSDLNYTHVAFKRHGA